jgi:hypothetical protein
MATWTHYLDRRRLYSKLRKKTGKSDIRRRLGVEIGGYRCPCPLNSGIFLNKTSISKEDTRWKNTQIGIVNFDVLNFSRLIFVFNNQRN